MQQMISQLAAHYTSNTDSQGSPQHNGNKDQSLLKARSIASPTIAATAAASAQNPVLSKLLMADQDAPLDLSFKRVKTEITEQDGVLDLSIKKHHSTDCTPPRNCSKPVVPRDSSDLGVAKVKDVQSTSTLEQFMAKLCLHHQRQVVDAFGFLQTEVKAVASTSTLQVCSPISQKPTTSVSSQAKVEQQLNRSSEETCNSVSEAMSPPGVQESASVKNKEFTHSEQPLKTEESLIASVETGLPVELRMTDLEDDGLSSSNVVGAECRSTNDQPKCPTLLIVKNRNSGSLEAKNVTEEVSDVQHLHTGIKEQSLCTSDTRLQASNSESDIIELSSSPARGLSEPKCCAVQRSPLARSRGSAARSCTVLRTSNVISQRGTARKSRKASLTLQKDSSGCHVLNGSDITCDIDIVYVDKPITECELQSRNRMLPRRNARKSTRGYRYTREFCELKTVRTLASKSAVNGSGNCPVPMPEMTTSVTPKHALAKPDGVPPVDVPFTGDCMEMVMNNNKPSEQPAETEVPADVLDSEDLIVETSQTGQIQSKEASEQSDPSVQPDVNAGIPSSVADHAVEAESEDPKDSNVENIKVKAQEVEPTTETIDAPISGVQMLAGPETEDRDPDMTTEALLSPSPSDAPKDGASEPDVCIKGGGQDENDTPTKADCHIEAVEQTDCPEMQVTTLTEDNAELQTTETNPISSEEGTKPTQDNTAESEVSDFGVEEAATKGQPEECKDETLALNTPDSFSPKKGLVKNIVSSDRCLRSRVSKGTSEQVLLSDTPAPTEVQSDIQESKHPSKTCKLKQVETSVPGEDGQNNSDASENPNPEKTQRSPVVPHRDGPGIVENMVCTRQKHKSMRVKETESDQEKISHIVLEVSTPKDEVEGKVQEQGCVPNDTQENVEVTPQKVSEESPGKSLRSSERMPLRSSSRQLEQPVSKVSSSPVKNTVQTSEQMPLRNSSAVDQPVAGDSCSSPTGSRVDRPARMPLRSRDGYNAESSPGRGPSESLGHMPLRSRNSSTVDQPPSGESSTTIKHLLSSPTEHPSSDLSVASRKTESTGHMPLRSGNVSIAEPPSSSTVPGNVSVSPGRMSLRRSNASVAEKMDSSATPPKNKKLPQKPQTTSKTSVPSSDPEGEQDSSGQSAKSRTDKLIKDQITDDSLPESSFIPVNLPTSAPVIPSNPSKFLEALNGEENQHLISDLNSKFDKMQKGWVQMDKEGQPAPRPKNKGDRLKEIWKSKRRIRKPRSLEQQKFSPVQMLFMKSFDLPSICRWFLQTTETKSLVIVKKVNTRLPSETQLCFHSSASVPGSSNGVFPSLQAERLKKHLKKFAIASPVKSNPKTKRLIAKALAQGISASKGKEKREPSTATRISTKPHSYSGLIQTSPPESHSKVAANTKNPASARILRKYSNMREKMQVQQNTLKNLERKETSKTRVMPKNVSKGMSTSRGQRSAIVKKVKALAKKAKAKSVGKTKTPKSGVSKALKGLKDRGGIPKKRVLTKVSKLNPVTSTKAKSKKETVVKTDKSPQTKTDQRKSPAHKGPEIMTSPSQTTEDQVLTRSQRKIEAALAQTGSPKTTTKRGLEPSPSSAKRTRTSK
ncbi:uncharacterized protein [Salminus brasiliensis]|uniref:uncharacterized protein n=1 Tax=Salminus brasiliensis TaxID=930266 RepID=UPI003B8398D5